MEMYLIRKSETRRTIALVERVNPRGEMEYLDVVFGGGGLLYKQDILKELTQEQVEKYFSLNLDFELLDKYLQSIINEKTNF